MLNKFDKWRLFLSSYLPLYILIIIQNYSFFSSMLKNILIKLNSISGTIKEEPPYKWIFFGVIIFLSLISFCTIHRFVISKSNRQFNITGKYEKTGDSIISYIFTYLVPLLSMDINNGNSIIVNLLLFIFIGVLYVAQDLIYLNPILALLGFSFYINDEKIIITKFSLEKLKEFEENGYKVKGNRLGSYIYVFREVISKEDSHM
ncbi:hypothetical protein [Enterococcus faecalis]|uniref:hypothetical protein n=1 Tax=Enterococcus faecalis TaxID=1351 RepID=UPI0002F3B380|nr:hypothetical protein [Enterococcus faecalis]EGO6633822.1 hypothetical protein [Enterococcus faecalis]PQD06319.1 hypothetical protein CUM78_00855 [Enterococcus faecalis]